MSLLAVRESGPLASRQVETFLLAQGAAFDLSGDIALNTEHREGDGSDHADVALNSAFVDPEGYNNGPLKAVLELADIISIETSTGGVFSKVKATLQILKDLIGGGGGGGTWELVESRAMTTNITELFTVGTDNTVKVEYEELTLNAAASQRVAFSQDGGSTYPSAHSQTGNLNRDSSTVTFGLVTVDQAYMDIDNLTDASARNGELIISGITGAGFTKMFKPWFDLLLSGSQWRFTANGTFKTNGPIDTIKIFNSGGKQMTGGFINLYKLIGPTP